MTLPPPHPSPQQSTATGQENLPGPRAAGSSQSASGPSSSSEQVPGRRILKPISTSAIGSSSQSGPSRGQLPQGSPSRSAPSPSPFAYSFSSVVNSSLRNSGSRQSPVTATSSSAFSPLQSGSQQPHNSQLLSSPRSRTIPPSTNPQLASSAAASTTASQGGGGGSSGGGGASRSATFSPTHSQSRVNSPTNTNINLNATTNPANLNLSNQAGQLSKIVIAQVFLLLSTIKEDKDKTKWESQADQIRKLIDSNGMEVFSKYFRRLVTGNSPQIFPGINRPVENAGNYQLLVNEMQKVVQDSEQAQKIAETIDASEGDIFKDFNLSHFMDHFKLDALGKTVLALAFMSASRSDLRTKADAILSNNFQPFLQYLGHPKPSPGSEHTVDLSPSFVAAIIDRFAQYPPRNLSEDGKARLVYAVHLRYQSQNMPVSPEVSTALQLFDLLGAQNSLARIVQRTGPKGTSSVEACSDILNSFGRNEISGDQISGALLFMVISQNRQQYSPGLFVETLRDHRLTKELDWQTVIHGFDREGLRITREQFLMLYNALLPISEGNENFDIQSLWGGRWHYPNTQLSFVTAFTSLPPTSLDVSKIPRLRKTFDTTLFDDASEDIKQHAARAMLHPLISSDAIMAIFDLVFVSAESVGTPESQLTFQEVVQSNMDIIMCSAFAVPKPWTDTQQEILLRMFYPFLLKQHPSFDFVLHGLWKQDKQWVATRLVEAHSQDPMQLPLLLDHAEAHGWLDDLFMILNGFGIDLAALANRRGILDLEQWARKNVQRGAQDFAFAVSRFLTIKAEDEMRTVRKEQVSPRTVSLAVKTIFSLLEILEQHLTQEDLVVVERLCIQAYPRLINYGEGFDDIIDANGEDSNAISEGADTKMQEHYKRMYSAELDVREIVEALQRYKTSRDPDEQDLFACMIHGLFDEYNCYHEYPLEALATTAVLFGGIINFNLISNIPLRVGLGMILEAVRDYGPESSMYKFGLQALLHFFNRLHEWPGFCSLLVQVPGLQGTEAYKKAEEVVRERANQIGHDPETNGMPEDGQLLTNGNIDTMFLPDANLKKFTFASLHVDPPLRPEIYSEPDEDVQDKVLFVLNNVSEQNLNVKLNDLREALDEKHHQWFAGYLVEERAKLQPNFQQLYLNMLELFGNKTLWSEVLRETYVSVVRMLNADSTLTSSTERSHLKNLGAWLGSLTIARDKPIKHNNISFKDLLIEGYDSQRLLVVIPFTCKVLIQATRSRVFRPPNPWIMDIIRLLMELYHFAELKLNLKFEIEVLCKDLNLDYKSIEPSTGVRERPHQEDDVSGQSLPDGLEGFEDLTLAPLNRSRAQNERFSPAAITSSLPDLGPLLVYPPSTSTVMSPGRLRQIVQTAIQRAILEIISPVVERSVTIAAIATAQLIQKDFAMEPSEEKVRSAALTMVKALSGSLALVTCKEPLRMSMTNYIRIGVAEAPEQALAEGAILMCVNDNLDTACSMVEKAAEQRSMPEIEAHIENLLESRRRHRESRPNEPFVDPIVNRWAFYIPEPFRQSASGLNKEQLAIYEEFARQSRGTPSHISIASQDSARPLPEVIQEQFAAVPNLLTPAEQPALPHPAAQQQQQQRMQPPPTVPAAVSQNQVNGYLDLNTLRERIQSLLAELQRATKSVSEEHARDLSPSSQPRLIAEQILRTVINSPHREEGALVAAQRTCASLYTQSEDRLEIEMLVQILRKLCQLSPVTAREVILWLANVDDERFFNVPVTVELLRVSLTELHRVDLMLTKAIQQRKVGAVEFLSDLMDEILLNDRPLALRADFASSLDLLGQWLAQEPRFTAGKQLIQKLKDAGVPEVVQSPPDERSRAKKDQLEYLFTEWVGIYNHPGSTEKLFASFIAQMHQKQVMRTPDDSALFFRFCIDTSVDAFEREERNPSGGNLNDAFICVDALAKMVVLLVKYHDEASEGSKPSKPAYLDSLLSLIVLVLSHHHTMRGEMFNQRVFFRLFSSILCEYHTSARQSPEQDNEVMLVFANKFESLQPLYFPGFTFGWLGLVSHRIFMPDMLHMADEAGWEPYAKIMVILLTYVGELLKPLEISAVAKDIYRGVLRVLLVLHHDFPEFLAENHFRLCNAIPTHCTQLRNLILSAYPSSFPELPDPFTAGLKVDRLEEVRRSPKVAGDVEGPLRQAKIKDVIDSALSGGVVEEQHIVAIAEAVHDPATKESGVAFAPVNADTVLLNAVVLYIGMGALSSVGQKGGPTFTNTSPHAVLLEKLAKELHPEARYHLLSAIANQLRYPNSHTYYFAYALLHLFGTDHADQQESDIRQQITRVLLERLVVHRPHPWGLIITLLELLKNPNYMFWDLPFIKAAPELIYDGGQIERLFGALFQHINQSPRSMT
ncbi:MAG: hypothetical protein M1819_003922 [Sarea resinae]|nr:MAG: hypothetical protein M1819_003922 [Sarea resinae]